jgi:hypothetical protein
LHKVRYCEKQARYRIDAASYRETEPALNRSEADSWRTSISLLAFARSFRSGYQPHSAVALRSSSFMDPFDQAPAAPAGSPGRPVLADTLQIVRRYELVVQGCAEPIDIEGTWLSGEELCKPEAEPLASLTQRFGSAGFKFNRRVAAAALMLRFGWGGGFAIASYLVQSRVPVVRDYALCFSPRTLLRWLCIRDAAFVGQSDDVLAGSRDWLESLPSGPLLRRLLESLIAFTEPVIVAQHVWSGFSRHALWAMATSSWASQFASIGRQLGDEGHAVRVARAMFSLDPEIERAAPHLYEVSSHGIKRTFQKMRACCLHFKNSDRRFCANCPIIPETERLEQNRAWLAAQQK